MSAAYALSQDVDKKAACEALAVPGATFYRHMNPGLLGEKKTVLFPFWPSQSKREIP